MHRLILSGPFRTLCAAVAILSAASGCVTMQQSDEMLRVQQQQREDSLLLQDDLRRIRARLDYLEQEMNRLSKQVDAAGADQARGYQSQMQGMTASIEDLQKRIRAVDAARESDKKEIVDTLSRRIQEVLKSSAPARSSASSTPRRAVSNEGYEHVVQSGETLSAIAKAYGVSSADIIQANGLKSADMLRVGQKLFIPAP